MLRIKQVLIEKHMSQAECARLASVNQTSLSRIVRGKEPPFRHRGKRIADALGWEGEVSELFEEVSENGAL